MVELKKALCILMVVAGVFVFAGIAGAQTCTDDPTSQFDKCRRFDCCDQSGFPNVCDIGAQGCETEGKRGCPEVCNKCAIRNIPCQGCTGGGENVGPTCTDSRRFDYDDPYGYCGSDKGPEFNADGSAVIDAGMKVAVDNQGVLQAKGKPARNCRFFINICECQDACQIEPGGKVGLQMVLKVNGENATLTDGVYWARDPNIQADNAIHFEAYSSTEFKEECKIMHPATGGRSFKDIRYYTTLTEGKVVGTDQGVGRISYVLGDERQPYPNATLTGKVPEANRATVLQSEVDYQLGPDPEGKLNLFDDTNKCIWMIDIPAVIIDMDHTKAGTKISVEVRLLWNKEAEKICQGCVVADICKCERDIAIVCCDVAANAANNVGCLFFPYVLQGLKDLPENQSGGWVSGVAISAVPVNPTTALVLPEGAKCTLTLRDTDGNTATWTNPDPGAGKGGLVWAFVLDSILPKFEGGPLKPGACSLMVETNYPIDGYTFMNANMQFGAGTLPRGCYGKIAPNSTE